jgi:glycosyltransferase involved in cell wall biosynthesis
MKIGIIGTRGIPNQYGGFEQFTEFVAPELVARGHEVTVYNSSLHPYKENQYKGVRLVHRKDPENKLGTFGQFIYDFNCIWHSRKQQFDIILQLGYTSSSVWTFLFPRKAVLVTNMDGLEWRRTKYSKPVRRFLLSAERWAALHSDALIADSKGIQQYLEKKYDRSSGFIPYGAIPVDKPATTALNAFGIAPGTYNLIIARMEPENNIETIIKGTLQAKTKHPLLIIGGYTNKFGQYLKSQYESAHVRFAGPVYDLQALNALRYYSNLYFHGHSVGGTNPSLLEAMASSALIVAHDNIFNRTVLEEDAFYFATAADIAALLDNAPVKNEHNKKLENNLRKIVDQYSWQHITNLLENFLLSAKKKA